MFQFHNGSIKSLNRLVEDICCPSFNSTMVRLKVLLRRDLARAIASFNSTMVRLKEGGDDTELTPDECFNSTMVRLKVNLNEQQTQ